MLPGRCPHVLFFWHFLPAFGMPVFGSDFQCSFRSPLCSISCNPCNCNAFRLRKDTRSVTGQDFAQRNPMPGIHTVLECCYYLGCTSQAAAAWCGISPMMRPLSACAERHRASWRVRGEAPLTSGFCCGRLHHGGMAKALLVAQEGGDECAKFTCTGTEYHKRDTLSSVVRRPRGKTPTKI